MRTNGALNALIGRRLPGRSRAQKGKRQAVFSLRLLELQGMRKGTERSTWNNQRKALRTKWLLQSLPLPLSGNAPSFTIITSSSTPPTYLQTGKKLNISIRFILAFEISASSSSLISFLFCFLFYLSLNSLDLFQKIKKKNPTLNRHGSRYPPACSR